MRFLTKLVDFYNLCRFWQMVWILTIHVDFCPFRKVVKTKIVPILANCANCANHADFDKIADFGKLQIFKKPDWFWQFMRTLANCEDFEKTCGFWQLLQILVIVQIFPKPCGFRQFPADFDKSWGFWKSLWILSNRVDFGKLYGF